MQIRFLVVTTLGSISLACVACTPGSSTGVSGSDIPTGQYEVLITRAEYGDAWPFTVESGVLRGSPTGRRLSNGTAIVEVTFRTGGKTYYVNGIAKGTRQYSELDDIWAIDSSMPKELAAKKSVGPIIERGLKLANGVDQPFVAPNPDRPRVPVSSGSIRCDQFSIRAKFEPGTEAGKRRLRISIVTDLPDITNLMLSIGRTYRNSVNNEVYSIDYHEEKASVAAWRAARVLELDQTVWQNRLNEKRSLFRRIGEVLNVADVDSAVTISFIVPVNQSDERFGQRNVNLVGSSVVESGGLRIVRREAKLEWPVSVQ